MIEKLAAITGMIPGIAAFAGVIVIYAITTLACVGAIWLGWRRER